MSFAIERRLGLSSVRFGSVLALAGALVEQPSVEPDLRALGFERDGVRVRAQRVMRLAMFVEKRAH